MKKDIYQQYILSFLTPKYTVNNIGDTGVKSLSEALMTNTTLTDIDLRGKHDGNQFVLIQNHHFYSNKTENIIGETGVASLSEALKINTALSILDLTCKHTKKATSMNERPFFIQINRQLRDRKRWSHIFK